MQFDEEFLEKGINGELTLKDDIQLFLKNIKNDNVTELIKDGIDDKLNTLNMLSFFPLILCIGFLGISLGLDFLSLFLRLFYSGLPWFTPIITKTTLLSTMPIIVVKTAKFVMYRITVKKLKVDYNKKLFDIKAMEESRNSIIDEYIKMILKDAELISKIQYDGFKDDLDSLYNLAKRYIELKEFSPELSNVEILETNKDLFNRLLFIEDKVQQYQIQEKSLRAQKEVLEDLRKMITSGTSENIDMQNVIDGDTMKLKLVRKFNKK